MLDFLKRDAGKVINVNDMDTLLGSVELIDIREPYECKGGSLKTSQNIPMDHLLTAPDNYLKKDKTYYIVCQSGARSGRTCSILSNQGFNVINVVGGMGSYVGTKKK